MDSNGLYHEIVTFCKSSDEATVLKYSKYPQKNLNDAVFLSY
jgi:hypothetical protein